MSKIVKFPPGGKKEEPGKKTRTFEDLMREAMVDGAIDLSIIDNAPAVGYNGGRKCDVTSGPCSCGAWH